MDVPVDHGPAPLHRHVPHRARLPASQPAQVVLADLHPLLGLAQHLLLRHGLDDHRHR